MVSEKKKEIVKQIADLINKYPIVGVVNMSGLPAPQLQTMRESLRKDVELIMARKKLMTLGLQNAGKEGVTELEKYFRGVPALLFTKENPFKLYAILEKSKSSAPAKGGQEAPKDIIVKAGGTPFAPGPIIGELGSIGIKTGVEGGKIAIKEDSVVVKEGEIISGKVAEILKRLDVKPMEIGLDLVAVWEDGTVFKGSDLRIDEAEYEQNIINAAQWAVNLSIEAGIPTADTIELMIIKAFNDAKAVALEGNILADAVIEEVLGKVEREALALKAEAKIETVAKPVEAAPKEEAKPEIEAPEPPKEISEEEKKIEEEIEEKLEEAEVKEEEEAKEEVKELEAPEAPKEEVKEEPEPEVKEEASVEEVKEEPVPEEPEVAEPVEEEAPAEETPEPEPEVEEAQSGEASGASEEEVKEEPAPTEEEMKEEAEERTPEELKDVDNVAEDIDIKETDTEQEHVEETEELPHPKETIEDTPDVELKEEEKEDIEEEAKEEVEEVSGRGDEVDVEEMKSRAEVIKERLEDLKEEVKEEASPAVKEMVKKTKEFAEQGRGPSAADLLEEVEEKAPEKKEEEVPTAQELYDRLKKKGTLRKDTVDNVPSAHELKKKKDMLKK
ncbi:50S ribosomal protein L10 [Nanoarchaeota archaeon]